MSRSIEPISNDDALIQDHEEFMRQVSESGVPIHLLRIYEGSTKTTNPYVNNQKDGQNGPIDDSTDTSL